MRNLLQSPGRMVLMGLSAPSFRRVVILILVVVTLMSCSMKTEPDQYFKMFSEDGSGIMACSGDWILEPVDRERGLVMGPMVDGLAQFWKIAEPYYTYINQDGEFPFDQKFDRTMPFSEGLAAVMVDGEWGFIDTTGAYVISPRFPGFFIGSFKNGLANVATEVTELNFPRSWIFINKHGEQVLGPYNRAESFSDGLAAVWRSVEGDEWVSGFINSSGEVILGFLREDKLSPAGGHSDGLFPVEDIYKQIREGNCSIGFMNKDAEWVIEPQYCRVGTFSDGLAPVSMTWNELWGYINTSGKMVIEEKYDIADVFSGGCARVAWGVCNGLIDTKGKLIHQYDPER